MYLPLSKKSRRKNRSRTNRLRAKGKAHNRRRVNRMARRKLGRRLGRAGD
jgi:hypothetical protein